MAKIIELLKQKALKNKEICYPSFFRISNLSDSKQLNELLETIPHLSVHDELQSQLEELIKSKNPKVKFSKEVLKDAVKSHLGNTPIEEYGVWVYYPWSARIVHILDEKEFIDLRTNRNLYKITLEERDILAKQKVGVIGLSVGQSVAVTMAMERLFGEIRLADFDVLELSNLNRIRTGIHNLGLNKAISVAREIAEIDPFLKVVCFTEGLTEENMDEFFLKEGRLNIIIDECDSIEIKVKARIKAKDLNIPVVMETSDRGMLDIERFDIEPERQIFHGLLDHLDYAKVKDFTLQEKKDCLFSIVNIDLISTRLKTSIPEIGKTISTWPQLGSSVALGGAVSSDVCRRIFLNKLSISGRFYIDLEKEISDNKKILQVLK